MRVETITPERAAHYLKRNVDNYRKISKAKVQLYADEMKAGKWQLNGEGIMFDETGRLKNGQHRLAAIILAKTPVQMTIIDGVKDDVTVYDTGMVRSTTQIAQASGCDNITTTESAVGTAIVGRFQKIGKSQTVEWLAKNFSELRRACKLAGANNRKALSGRAGCVLGAYLSLRCKEMKAYEIETFFKVFNSGNIVGTDGYEASPALVARRMFEERYRGVGGSKPMKEQAEIILMAMSDFKGGKKRQMNYQVKEPFECLELVDKIRKEDGLE